MLAEPGPAHAQQRLQQLEVLSQVRCYYLRCAQRPRTATVTSFRPLLISHLVAALFSKALYHSVSSMPTVQFSTFPS